MNIPVFDPSVVRSVSATQVRQWLEEPEEIAFIDVREEGEFGWGHPLLAVNLPYSRLEADVERLVPRKGTRIVLIDGDGIIAARAARRLKALGYTNLHAIDEGIDGWKSAGFPVFQGVNVPSKSFAEVVEHAYHTPDISAEDLKRLQDGAEDFIILDSRTEEEFDRFHVPGAISVPGGELVHRFDDVVTSPDTLVVVSCAGRTRGIMGAQTLINAAVPNRVVALAGGTQGWRLAGLPFESGPRPSHIPSTQARAKARERADALNERYGVRHIDHDTLAEWRADAARTTVLIDVRSPEEFAAGHLAGTVSVPGGQLVQTLDEWVAVRRARLVLVDDDGVRSTITAHWLNQLGWDAFALDGALEARELVTGADEVSTKIVDVNSVTAAEAQSWLAEDGQIVSASPSGEFRKGHPASAVWAIRPRIDGLPETVRKAPKILVVGSDPALAALLAVELGEAATGEVRVLSGGDAAWRAAGLPWTEADTEPADHARIDFLTWNHDRHQGNLEASRAYLDWEGDLPRQVAADGGAQFSIDTP
ncbi:rhodanese-like domain-containing protein [Terrihabitans sp. B22-R8]|uniref:rhodanese-like domain-containing protein n=1 Tax=Terrihabitans sp. B22-R8 TaxID=3425128 RepID=UPI00403C834F